MKKLAVNFTLTFFTICLYFLFLYISESLQFPFNIAFRYIFTNFALIFATLFAVKKLNIGIPLRYKSQKLNYILIFSFLLNIITAIFFFSDQNSYQSSTRISELLTLLILVPFAEELFFRGYIFSLIKKSTSEYIALILVSVFFALLHINGELFVPMAVLSVILCLILIFSDSVLWTVSFHFLWNLASILKEQNSNSMNDIFTVVIIFQIILFLLTCILKKKETGKRL